MFKTPTSWYILNHKEPPSQPLSFILKLGSRLNVLLSSRETKIHWHRVPQLYIKKRHIPVTQSLKKKNEKNDHKRKKSTKALAQPEVKIYN